MNKECNHLKRKLPRALILLLAGIVVGLAASGLLHALTDLSLFGENAGLKRTSAADNAHLSARAYEVLENIKDNDFSALSRVAHPQKGVLFSPCATVSPEINKRFLPKQLAAFGTDTNVYIWGVASIDGRPIEMAPLEYINGVVYDRDYIMASTIGINTIIKSGNALENVTEEFPDMRFVDFFVPGYEGGTAEDLSWGILRLGFESDKDEYKLTLILNSSWTG